MKIVYIHGATASERSFAFIQKSLDCKDPIYLNYSKHTAAVDNLAVMMKTLNDIDDDDFFVIAHSLGGVYATYLQSEFDTIKNVVSLATPFNGSEIASWGTVFNPHYQLFKDISPNSEFIRYSRKIDIECPWMQVVTTVGDVPWISGENDGIVTRKSMTCRDDIEYAEVDRNHYEIVLSDRVIEIINNKFNT
jgi:hypothetical protein